MILGIGLLYAMSPLKTIALLLVIPVGVSFLVWCATRLFRGITGDILGTTNEMMEIVFLVSAPLLISSDLRGTLPMKRRILKCCERCQQDFVCGLFGCWCSKVDVTDIQYSKIVAQYHDCLCPSCLSQISGNSHSNPDNQASPPHTPYPL